MGSLLTTKLCRKSRLRKMVNESYVKGRKKEQYLKLKFKKQGWFVVRAAASKPIDLVLIKKSEDGKPIVKLIESKKAKYVKPKERKKLKRLRKLLK